jgi:hypothetical protein
MIKRLIAWLLAWRPNQEQVAAAVRWLLGVAGAWAVQRGYIDDSQATMIIGVGVAIVPLVWSFIIKTHAQQAKGAAALPDVKVLVGPNATESVKELARDPAEPNIQEVKWHGID